LEGVTLRLNAVVQLIRKAVVSAGGSEPPRIIASGRALEVNTIWRQMIADCTGLTVVFDSETQEGTSRGVVCMISRALEMDVLASKVAIDLHNEQIQVETLATPRETASAYWANASATQEDLIANLSPMFEL
jgi:gluconokinase